jgi:hypothetical protein
VLATKANVTPVPVADTVSGPPAPSLVITIDAGRLPVALGLKVTLTLQVALGWTADVHVFVCEKSLAFVPLRPTPDTFSGVVPLFVTVMVCAADVVPTT